METDLRVAITLEAGDEYPAFNPNPTEYLLNNMGYSSDGSYYEQSFSGVLSDLYVFNFRYWSYRDAVVNDFEESLIEYFTSDSARLIAPIRSVSVTSSNGTTYFIVSDGNVTLDGYPSI